MSDTRDLPSSVRKSKRKRVPTNRLMYKDKSTVKDEPSKISSKRKYPGEKAGESTMSVQESRITAAVRKAYDRVKRIHAYKRASDIKCAWDINYKNVGSSHQEQMNLRKQLVITTNNACNSPNEKSEEEEDPHVIHRGVIFPFAKSSEQVTAILSLNETSDRKSIENCREMKADVVTLPSLTKIPPVLAWTSIPYNVHEDDGKFLTNIPFLGDEIIDKDKKFIDDMMNLYEGKVHGISDTSAKKMRMGEDVYYDLVQALLELEKTSGSQLLTKESLALQESSSKRLKTGGDDAKGNKGGSQNKEGSFNSIFAAVASTFKGMGTPGELKERYDAIAIKKSQTIKKLPLLKSGVEQQDPSTYSIPNIEGEFAKDLPKDSAMHAYQYLFCRRCFQYDCTRGHNGDDQVDLNYYKAKRNSQGVSSLNFICDNVECWEKMSSESTKSKETILSEWTPGDKSMFRCLVESFPNHCYIANLMMTKTCVQVHEYAPLENAPTGDPEGTSTNTSPSKGSSAAPIKRRSKPWNKKSGSSVNKKNLARRWINNVKKSSGGIKTGGVLPPKFMPCQHETDVECDDKNPNCYCGMNGTSCEKFCNCSETCKRRFPGCRCVSTCDSKRCVCYFAARECDPDICSGCGAHDSDVSKITCRNVNIQRRLHKHLLMGKSDVAGWGIFIKEDVQKGEFIAEYRGEIISHDESERRGHVYDKIQHTFLFELNDHFVVDATRKGNKSRFVNSSKAPNCEVKRMLVNGDHRIGIYAKRYIEAGEELFYDYEDVLEKQQKVATASAIAGSSVSCGSLFASLQTTSF